MLRHYSAVAMVMLAGGALLADEVKQPASRTAPTLVVRLQSIDGLVSDLKYLATSVGQEEPAKQFDGFLQTIVGEKGLEGIDTKRPLGAYGILRPDFANSMGVLLVPVADEKAVLDLLERLNLKANKGADGIYTARPDNSPFDVYFRFANKYAYITAQNKRALEPANLLDPEKALATQSQATMSALFRFSQIPDALKQMALGLLELRMATAKEEKGNAETPAQHALKGKIIDEITRRLGDVVKDGGDLRLSFDIDRKAAEVSFAIGLSAREDTKLTAAIADLGQARSLFAGAMGPDAAVHFLVHLTLPEGLRKALEPVIDDAAKKAMENAPDEARRQQTEKFIKALDPTAKSGELDLGISLRGPGKDGTYTFVAGLKLKEGAALDRALGDLVKALPERDRERIQIGAESAGDVKIHKLDVASGFDDKARRILGENPIYVAIRDNALVLGAGPEALSAVKDMLAAEPKVAPALLGQMSVARVAPLMALVDPQKNKDAAAVAKKVFGDGGSTEDKIQVRFAGGTDLSLRFSVKTLVLKFGGEIDKQRKNSTDGNSSR